MGMEKDYIIRRKNRPQKNLTFPPLCDILALGINYGIKLYGGCIMFCLKCGRRLSDEDQFCQQCGTAVTPKLQQLDEINADGSVGETEIAEESKGAILLKTEEEAQSENVDTDENSLRPYQEPAPVPVPVPGDVQNPEPAPVYVQAPPPQPQATTQMLPAQPQAAAQTPFAQQQAAAQPPYQQTTTQPQYYPASDDVTAAMRQLPPFMKRKEYFKSPAAGKIKGKVDLLSFFTGMGLGVVMVFATIFLLLLLSAIYSLNILPNLYDGTSYNIDTKTMMTASIVGLSVSAVLILFYILGMKTKRFGFYIFLMLPPLCLTGLMAYTLIKYPTAITGVSFLTQNLNFVMLIILTAAAALALILSVLSLIFSIIISNSYKNAQKEYMWRAASGNTQ